MFLFLCRPDLHGHRLVGVGFGRRGGHRRRRPVQQGSWGHSPSRPGFRFRQHPDAQPQAERRRRQSRTDSHTSGAVVHAARSSRRAFHFRSRGALQVTGAGRRRSSGGGGCQEARTGTSSAEIRGGVHSGHTAAQAATRDSRRGPGAAAAAAAGKVGTIRYDTRCYFNVRSKADVSQLNLPHGTDN